MKPFFGGQKWKFARISCWRRRGVEGHEGWILDLNPWYIIAPCFVCTVGQATIGNAEFSDAKILENLKFFVGTWVWRKTTSRPGTGLVFTCLWLTFIGNKPPGVVRFSHVRDDGSGSDSFESQTALKYRLACFLSVSQHGKKYCSVCWGLINIRRSYLRKDCQYVELKGPVRSSKQVLTLHKGANLLAHHSLEGKVQASVCRPPSHPATSWILVWLVRIRVFWEVRVHLKRRPCYGKRRIKCSTASITLVLYPGQLFSRSSHAIGNEGSTYTPGALVTSWLEVHLYFTPAQGIDPESMMPASTGYFRWPVFACWRWWKSCKESGTKRYIAVIAKFMYWQSSKQLNLRKQCT